MALNKYMHPRNQYKTKKPDFKALAIKYDYFRDKATQSESGSVMIDFKEPACLRALTQALLEDDFGLKVTLPLDRLIPTVPQRLNYILWLEDIVGQNKQAKGIDIGTGSSCIYPLLGCRQNGWQFLASEVDEQNVFFAEKNVKQNNMTEKITIKQVSEETLLLGLLKDTTETYDFSMCNPPFYTDHLEAQGVTSSRSIDRSEPRSLSTASEGESVAWGGEVRFVSQMIQESLQLNTRVRVYTSLLGKKNSLHLLKDVFNKNKISHYSTTEFCQGRTMRWGIAWSFDESVVFPKSVFKEQKKVKLPLTHDIVRDAGAVTDYTVQAYTWFLRKHVEDLQIDYYTNHSGKFYTCFTLQAKTNTWSHQRRRRRQHSKQQSGDEGAHQDQTPGTGINVHSNTEEQEEAKNIQNQDSVKGDDVANKISGEQTDCKIGTKHTAENKIHIEGENSEKGNDISIHEKGDDVVERINSETTHNAEQNMETDQNKHVTSKESDGNIMTKKRGVSDTSDGADAKRFKTEEAQMGQTGNEDPTEIDMSSEESKTKTEDKQGTASYGTREIGTSCEGCIPETEVKQGTDSSETKEISTSENSDSSANTLSRKKVIEQFWKEKEENEGGKGKKKPHSFYEKLEPFSETDECLLLCKMVIRKEEGKMSLSLTHIAGNREAMHQIMQYFKNILAVGKKS